MDIEDINKMWTEDSEINQTNLTSETARIPVLHNKYYMLYVREALKVKKLKSDLKELEKSKIEYYNGSMDEAELRQRGWKPNPLKILRQDLDRYVESDKDIINLSLKIAYHESAAKYLEEIVRQLNNRNFLIKNMIDYMKFTSGTG
jgi:hypothetical protein